MIAQEPDGEVAIVPAYALAVYPANLSFQQGTSIWMQYLTAYGALVWLAGIGPGDHVLLTAPSSSVGLAAIEICMTELRVFAFFEDMIEGNTARKDCRDRITEVNKLFGELNSLMQRDSIFHQL